jgi:hypothetical protein
MLPGLEDFLNKSLPGCYDDPGFSRFEQKNSTLAFQGYAQHVLKRKLGAVERARVGRIASFVLETMIAKSSADDLRARCYPFSVAVMKCLEKCGIWSFMLIGSTLFTFPENQTRTFVLEKGSPGHAWLVVPPFKIVDATAYFQHWQDGEEEFLPKWIAVRKLKRASKEKLFEPSLLPTDDGGQYIEPSTIRFWKKFPPGQISVGTVSVYYQPYKVAIPDIPLSESGAGLPAQRFLVILPKVSDLDAARW